MTESQRLDRYASYAIYDVEIISISADQYAALERAGRRKFDSSLRERIEKALYFFIVSKDQDILASTIEQQSTLLKKLQKSVQELYDFFNLADPSMMEAAPEGAIRRPGWHAAFRVKHRIEDALIFEKNEDNEVLWGDWYLERPRELSISATKELLEAHRTEPLVNLDELQITLNWLRLAGMRAAARLEAECKADKGAREIDKALDGLLVNLDDIYDKAPGKVRGKMNFIFETMQLIPERIRPTYTADQLGAIRGRIKLAKSRYDTVKKRKSKRSQK